MLGEIGSQFERTSGYTLKVTSDLPRTLYHRGCEREFESA